MSYVSCTLAKNSVTTDSPANFIAVMTLLIDVLLVSYEQHGFFLGQGQEGNSPRNEKAACKKNSNDTSMSALDTNMTFVMAFSYENM